MQERGETVHWPPNPAPHLVDWLLEIGPTQPVGMGDGPIGWQEMTAWEKLTGIELDPFEARALRRMSRAFLLQRQDARKPDCPAPYSSATPKETEEKVTAQFKAMVDTLKARKQGEKR